MVKILKNGGYKFVRKTSGHGFDEKLSLIFKERFHSFYRFYIVAEEILPGVCNLLLFVVEIFDK